MSWWTLMQVMENIATLVLMRQMMRVFGPELIDAYVVDTTGQATAA